MKGKVAFASLWVAASGKQFAKGRADFVHSRRPAIIPLITRLRMSYEGSYARVYLFKKMVLGSLGPEMIEGTVKIVNESIKDNVQVNLIINNRVGGNAPPIGQAITERRHLA